MAHLVENMAYVGRVPWHGLGNPLDPNTTIEEWQKQAGADYDVAKKQIFFLDNSHEVKAELIPDKVALIREDTKKVLGLVSKDYHIVQPKEVLEFYRDLTSDAGFSLETAGVLDDGKRVWALANTNKNFNIQGIDEINGYFLLATSYDGSFATTASFTSIRVVCNNTLTFALDNMVNKKGMRPIYMKIRHNTKFDADSVKAKLGLLDDSWERYHEQAAKMAETRLTRAEAIHYFYSLFADDQLSTDYDKDFLKEYKDKVFNLLEIFKVARGQEIATANGTLWGAVNAVTYEMDWNRIAGNPDNRFISAQWGDNAKTKEIAYNRAVTLLAA